jgi:hypothetical protein
MLLMTYSVDITDKPNVLLKGNNMKIMSFCIVLMLSLISCSNTTMKQAQLEHIVKGMASESTGEKGAVEFLFNDTKMVLLSDIKHDRMRIITVVADYEHLDKSELDAILQSNFHLALDARYAVSHKQLYSAFIHPLSSLTEEQVKSAVVQVHNLARSFGNQYSSGVLSFGGGDKKPQAIQRSEDVADKESI